MNLYSYWYGKNIVMTMLSIVLVVSEKGKGEGDLKERGELNKFLAPKRRGLLEGGLIDDLRNFPLYFKTK